MTSYRHLFDIPSDIAFLTAASYSPLPKSVQAAGNEGVARKGQPWRIDRAFRNSQNERARSVAARLIGADADDVALVPSVGYGFATAAGIVPLKAGDRIIVLENDHSSPVLAWETPANAAGATVETVSPPTDEDWTKAVLDAMARPNAGPIAVVSISNVHWADGALLDVVAIAEAARAAGALIAVDATQAVGAVPVDVRHIDPDFLMFPTYKWLLGPYGRAFLYVAKRHQNAIPLEQTASGRMDVNSESETYLSDTRYVENARRFDMGERDHFITMEMASVGMELIETVGVSAVFQHVEQLTHRVQSAFPKLIAGNAQSRSPHILSLNVGADRAKPICHALAQQNIHVSPRIGRVRVSPHIYNDDADIDRLIDALRPLVEAA